MGEIFQEFKSVNFAIFPSHQTTCINKFIVAMSCSLLSDYFTIQRLLTLNFELKVTTILKVLTTLASNLFHRAVWLPAA